MSLRDWIASFPIPATATTATTATKTAQGGQLSQLSQLSQAVGAERAEQQAPDVSQLSQPFGGAGAHGSDDDREAFEERAAIMEFDGGLSRAEAERHAVRPHTVAPAPPTAGRPWRGEGLDLDDLRPCLWCRNLARSGRCLAAWRGELRAARDWEPTFPDQPQRCIGYSPAADDQDQRPGRERWPELIRWQARIRDDTR